MAMSDEESEVMLEDPETSRNEASLSCDQCEEIFSSSRDWMVHVREEKDHKAVCKTCDISFKNYDNMRHHKRKYHFEKSACSEFYCESCGKGCRTKDLLKDHWNFVHKVESGLNCNLCGKSCQNMLKLRKHTQLCLNRDPVIVAKERANFEATLGSNEIENPVGDGELDDHGKKFISTLVDPFLLKNQFIESAIKEESKTSQIASISESQCPSPNPSPDHGMENVDEKEEIKEDENTDLVKIETEPDIDEWVENLNKMNNLEKMSPNKATVCTICSEKVKNLNKHIREVHAEISPGTHTCNQCGKDFSKQKSLKYHIDTVHKKPEVCPICGKEVKYLNGHIKEVHTNKPSEDHHCHLCGKTFNNLKRLRGHIDTVHKLPEVCPICAKEVKYLNGHIKAVHTESPPGNHICNYCGKVFSRLKKLRGHIDAVHKVQPTLCDICSQEFKNVHALRGHKAKVHGGVSEVNCPSCFKVFENRLKLYYHERAVHTFEDAVCNFCGKTYKNKNLLQKHMKVYHKDLYVEQKRMQQASFSSCQA